MVSAFVENRISSETVKLFHWNCRFQRLLKGIRLMKIGPNQLSYPRYDKLSAEVGKFVKVEAAVVRPG